MLKKVALLASVAAVLFGRSRLDPAAWGSAKAPSASARRRRRRVTCGKGPARSAFAASAHGAAASIGVAAAATGRSFYAKTWNAQEGRTRTRRSRIVQGGHAARCRTPHSRSRSPPLVSQSEHSKGCSQSVGPGGAGPGRSWHRRSAYKAGGSRLGPPARPLRVTPQAERPYRRQPDRVLLPHGAERRRAGTRRSRTT